MGEMDELSRRFPWFYRYAKFWRAWRHEFNPAQSRFQSKLRRSPLAVVMRRHSRGLTPSSPASPACPPGQFDYTHGMVFNPLIWKQEADTWQA